MTNLELIDGLRSCARWAGVDAYKFSLSLAADRLELYSEAVRLANIALFDADHVCLRLDTSYPERAEHLADGIEGMKDAVRAALSKVQP